MNEGSMERKIIVDINPYGFGENQEYHFNAQVWVFLNGRWWYGGTGKYCKTIEDVLLYATEMNLEIEFR